MVAVWDELNRELLLRLSFSEMEGLVRETHSASQLLISTREPDEPGDPVHTVLFGLGAGTHAKIDVGTEQGVLTARVLSDEFIQSLSDIVAYSDAADVGRPGWHAHFPQEEGAKLQAGSVWKILIAGPGATGKAATEYRAPIIVVLITRDGVEFLPDVDAILGSVEPNDVDNEEVLHAFDSLGRTIEVTEVREPNPSRWRRFWRDEFDVNVRVTQDVDAPRYAAVLRAALENQGIDAQAREVLRQLDEASR